MIDLKYLNELFLTYSPTLDAIDKIIGIAISAGLFWLAHRANGIANSNLELARQEKETRKYNMDKDKRDVFRSAYRNISDALALVWKDGRVGHEALALFWQARDQARLELPDDIEEYLEELKEAACNAFAINDAFISPRNRPGLQPSEELEQKTSQHLKHILFLQNAQPHAIFSKYMKEAA